MNEYELIDTVRGGLNHAEQSMNKGNHLAYCKHMSALLDLLIEKLIGGPPAAHPTPTGKFNPEQVLVDVASAIKHRTISIDHHWKIIFYHSRITCVPKCFDVPSQIVLHEFSEKMANVGFSTIYWNQLKQNVTKLYRELKQ